MDKFTGQNILDFMEVFPNDDECKRYLAELKWHDGFACCKCGHTKGCLKSGHRYHCYGCGHVESATANTLFHKVKFGLRKAFCIVFEMNSTTKSLSSIQMGLRYGIRQGSAWYFMHKVRKAMESSKKHPLEGLVHVDEFTIGGKEANTPGRSYNTNKTKAIVAVELTQGRKIKRVYAQTIEDYSAKSFTPLFEQHIGQRAHVVTDKWSGYSPLKKDYDLEQIPSEEGRNFKELHVVVHQIKSWLRTVPSHVSKAHVQRYLDEFCFRINRSQFKETIFHKAVERMVEQRPWYQTQIIRQLSV